VSKDLVTWSEEGYVFTPATKPAWSTTDFWAPELHHIKSTGRVNVYYAARNKNGIHCIGVGYANSPTGPFMSPPEPLACNTDIGFIYPTFLATDTTQYLYWKVDGNSVGQPSVIYAQELTADGLSLAPGSKEIYLIRNDLAWEAGVVEAPWVIPYANNYYLFYSGNGYAARGPDGTCLYAIGVARSTTPVGPFVKHGDPILVSIYSKNPFDLFTGPGHCSVVNWNSTTQYMVYHAWSTNEIAGPYPRHMMTDKVVWQNNWPIVYDGHPSDTPKRVP